jgi:hypothetical protein
MLQKELRKIKAFPPTPVREEGNPEQSISGRK